MENFQNYRFVYKYEYIHKYDYLTKCYRFELTPKLVKEYYADTKYVSNGTDTYDVSNVSINKNSDNPCHIKNIFSWETHLFTPEKTIHITRICKIPIIVNGHFLSYNTTGIGTIIIICVAVGCSFILS